MSIVISFVGLQVNNKTKEIYKRQLEIVTNDREPYFTIKSEKISERSYDNSENYDTDKEIKISHEEKEGIYIGQELGDNNVQQIIKKIQKVIKNIKK